MNMKCKCKKNYRPIFHPYPCALSINEEPIISKISYINGITYLYNMIYYNGFILGLKKYLNYCRILFHKNTNYEYNIEESLSPCKYIIYSNGKYIDRVKEHVFYEYFVDEKFN